MWSQKIVLFQVKLILRMLCAKNNFSKKTIFPGKVDIKGAYRPFLRKVDFKGNMSEKPFFKKDYFSHVIKSS